MSGDASTRLDSKRSLRGRGVSENPTNRFEHLHVEDDSTEEYPNATTFLRDNTQSILSTNNSPDLGFRKSLNPYRGCEHGCSYCYARPTHEYLGFSAGLDFETRILIKERAPQLLQATLSSPKWKPECLMMSGVTDCYQPIEKKLEITRNCLKILAEFRNPVSIITKNFLVTRDLDHLKTLAHYQATAAFLSITSLDNTLTRILEPRASAPSLRLKAIETLRSANIPVGVSISPVIPCINDHEIPSILNAAASAGAQYAFYIMLRLPHGVKELFAHWLEHHFPKRKEKTLTLIREMRGGQLNDTRFSHRFRPTGPYAEHIRSLFEIWKQKTGFLQDDPELSTHAFRKIEPNQLELF